MLNKLMTNGNQVILELSKLLNTFNFYESDYNSGTSIKCDKQLSSIEFNGYKTDDTIYEFYKVFKSEIDPSTKITFNITQNDVQVETENLNLYDYNVEYTVVINNLNTSLSEDDLLRMLEELSNIKIDSLIKNENNIILKINIIYKDEFKDINYNTLAYPAIKIDTQEIQRWLISNRLMNNINEFNHISTDNIEIEEPNITIVNTKAVNVNTGDFGANSAVKFIEEYKNTANYLSIFKAWEMPLLKDINIELPNGAMLTIPMNLYVWLRDDYDHRTMDIGDNIHDPSGSCASKGCYARPIYNNDIEIGRAVTVGSRAHFNEYNMDNIKFIDTFNRAASSLVVNSFEDIKINDPEYTEYKDIIRVQGRSILSNSILKFLDSYK